MKTNLTAVEEEARGARGENGVAPKEMEFSESGGGGGGPGRPSGCTPEAVGLLRGVIRELGLSDSAAARRLEIGASTLSRWKRENTEVRQLLQQAREECRAVQLQCIMHAAAAEHGRGWRAAAWLLERLFPEDYAPHAGAREGHRSVAEARERREEEAAEAEGRWQRACEAAQQQKRASDAAFVQGRDCRNCRNSAGEAPTGRMPIALDPPTGRMSVPLPADVAQCFQPVGGSGDFGGAELHGAEEVAFAQEGIAEIAEIRLGKPRQAGCPSHWTHPQAGCLCHCRQRAIRGRMGAMSLAETSP